MLDGFGGWAKTAHLPNSGRTTQHGNQSHGPFHQKTGENTERRRKCPFFVYFCVGDCCFRPYETLIMYYCMQDVNGFIWALQTSPTQSGYFPVSWSHQWHHEIKICGFLLSSDPTKQTGNLNYTRGHFLQFPFQRFGWWWRSAGIIVLGIPNERDLSLRDMHKNIVNQCKPPIDHWLI